MASLWALPQGLGSTYVPPGDAVDLGGSHTLPGVAVGLGGMRGSPNLGIDEMRVPRGAEPQGGMTPELKAPTGPNRAARLRQLSQSPPLSQSPKEQA
jgi:hypothetical protein